MDHVVAIITLLFGFALGCAAMRLLLRSKVQQAIERVASERNVDLATAQERIRYLELQIAQLKQGVESCRAEVKEREAHIDRLASEKTALQVQNKEFQTRIDDERKAAAEKLALLEEAQARLSNAFKALSAEALSSNNRSFLELAKESLVAFQEGAKGDLQTRQKAIDELVKPLKETLQKVVEQIDNVEKSRLTAYTSLTEQVKSLGSTQSQLQMETSNLVRALRSPVTRGRWGEIQLRRVVEMAGMVEYCDFEQQVSVEGEAGQLRPDMVIRMPNGKNVVVDSKVSLSAYLESLEASDDGTKTAKLKEHSKQVRAYSGREQLGNPGVCEQ